ncbi:MAG: hypothetical protein ACD_12C00183G0001 [uncultured bacterium]|nr:MAG: hypothetical protein ACD_12C00183G0001 [uncultured bacterium]
MLGIVGLKFFNIGQRGEGILRIAEAAEETNITYQNMIEDFEKDPVSIDQPGPDGWF